MHGLAFAGNGPCSFGNHRADRSVYESDRGIHVESKLEQPEAALFPEHQSIAQVVQPGEASTELAGMIALLQKEADSARTRFRVWMLFVATLGGAFGLLVLILLL